MDICDYGCFIGPPILTDWQLAALIIGANLIFAIIVLIVLMGIQLIKK